jgi:transposase
MPKKRVLKGDINEIAKTMKMCKNASDYRRIQCVYLGILHPDMTAKKIAEITLYSENHVKIIHANYRKNGPEGLEDSRGGRYRQYLSIDEEVKFLEPFEEKSKTGTLVVANEVKKAYEAKVGKEVAESTIYRLLDRHDFRKIVPFKRHKKADIESQETFKKTSLQ